MIWGIKFNFRIQKMMRPIYATNPILLNNANWLALILKSSIYQILILSPLFFLNFQQASQLAKQGFGGNRLDKAFYLREGLKSYMRQAANR